MKQEDVFSVEGSESLRNPRLSVSNPDTWDPAQSVVSSITPEWWTGIPKTNLSHAYSLKAMRVDSLQIGSLVSHYRHFLWNKKQCDFSHTTIISFSHKDANQEKGNYLSGCTSFLAWHYWLLEIAWYSSAAILTSASLPSTAQPTDRFHPPTPLLSY